MNEYVCGNNICRAFIRWGSNVYCTLFSFFYVEREGKKLEKKERKREWKKILIHLVHVSKEKKKKKLERNILRNNQFSNEMKDSRILLAFFSLSMKEEKENRRKKGENMLSLTPSASCRRKFC